jgi:hypothetical protein
MDKTSFGFNSSNFFEVKCEQHFFSNYVMLNVAFFIVMLNAIMRIVVMLSVVEPLFIELDSGVVFTKL